MLLGTPGVLRQRLGQPGRTGSLIHLLSALAIIQLFEALGQERRLPNKSLEPVRHSPSTRSRRRYRVDGKGFASTDPAHLVEEQRDAWSTCSGVWPHRRKERRNLFRIPLRYEAKSKQGGFPAHGWTSVDERHE